MKKGHLKLKMTFFYTRTNYLYFHKGLEVRKHAPLVHTCMKKLRHLALVRRLFLHKYMSHRNAINLMAFNDIGGSKAKKSLPPRESG